MVVEVEEEVELRKRTRGVEAVRETLNVEREGRESIGIVWEKVKGRRHERRRKR